MPSTARRRARCSGPRSPTRSVAAMRTVVTSGTGTRARSPATSSPARPARPRATATPGSSASPATTPSRSGSATRTSSTEMDTSFQGEPVAGGTFPAAIFNSFLTDVLPEKDADPDRADGRRPSRRRTPPVPETAPVTPSTDAARRPPPRPPPRSRRPPRRRRRPPRPRPRRRPSTGTDGRHRHRRRPRPRPASAQLSPGGQGRDTLRDPDRAEAPRQLGRLGDADARAGDDARRSRQPGGGGPIRTGPRPRSVAFSVELDPERLGQLARARAEVDLAARGRAVRA